MMIDYLNGHPRAFVEVESPILEMPKMTGRVLFRDYEQMDEIEKKALKLCKGHVLDAGAGSGCHSIWLQNKKQQVTALDISPGAVFVMEQRGIKNIIHDSLLKLKNVKFDTILMLMNGIGICGSIDGLNLFMQFIRTVLSSKGQILADSMDLKALYRNKTPLLANEAYYGETRFSMRYKNIQGDPFDWLYIDFSTLKYFVSLYDFKCEKILEDEKGHYLARIY